MSISGSTRLRRVLALFVAVALASALSVQAAVLRVVKLKGVDALQFDVKRIEAKPGEALEIELTTESKMAKQEMAHNFVLLAKNAPVDSFVMEAMMARATEYMPAPKKPFVLAATALAGNGETVKVAFTAPKEPGEYVYICTFPGHYTAGMKGVLVVK